MACERVSQDNTARATIPRRLTAGKPVSTSSYGKDANHTLHRLLNEWRRFVFVLKGEIAKGNISDVASGNGPRSGSRSFSPGRRAL